MQQLTGTVSGLFNSLFIALNSFMAFIPTLLGALLVLAIGWFVSAGVARLLEKGLTKVGFEHAIERTGINGVIAKTGTNVTMSHVVGLLFKWMIRLVFIQAAANILGMPQVTTIINSIVLFIPKVAVALLIVVVGSLVAGVLARIVQGSLAQSNIANSARFAALARYAVMGFAFVAALSQLEIAPVIINSLFIALIGSVALAVGLSFGLGGRDVASELTRNWYERGKDVTSRSGSGTTGQPLRDASSQSRRTGT